MDGRSVASSALSESQCESTAFSSSVDALASLPAVAASLMRALAVGSSSLSEDSERRRRWIGDVGVLRFVGRKVAMRMQTNTPAVWVLAAGVLSDDQYALSDGWALTRGLIAAIAYRDAATEVNA